MATDMTAQSSAAASTISAAPRRRGARSDSRTATVVTMAVLVLLAIIYIYPFVVQVLTSFKTNADAVSNPLGMPQIWTVEAYQRLFTSSDYPLWFRNSVIVTLFVTAGRVFFNSLAGYALARLRFPGRALVFSFLVAVMAVPGVVLLIPKFLVINTLGIYNTFFGLILPLLVDAAGVFIMKNYFESIPASVEEAARIDGAGTFRVFWSVVLPMARPALITITILSFQGSWNELSHFIVAANDRDLFNLTRGVASLTSGALGSSADYPLKMGAAALMTIPVAVLFFVFQKRIMGTSDGAVKG
ncbi:carbohydrate ABC transporter permease [Pseudactinotalea sp.]|uniref:carbohydrate ABC transporter permease n=1 Tax=Pseudactinotalea sp. TaxID=1926260 RepID=UPI003B3AB7FD